MYSMVYVCTGESLRTRTGIMENNVQLSARENSFSLSFYALVHRSTLLHYHCLLFTRPRTISGIFTKFVALQNACRTVPSIQTLSTYCH